MGRIGVFAVLSLIVVGVCASKDGELNPNCGFIKHQHDGNLTYTWDLSPLTLLK
jgi:hypothetical protein